MLPRRREWAIEVIDIVSAISAIKPKAVRQPIVRACNLEDVRLTVESYALTEAQKLILYRRHGYRQKPTDRDIIRAHIDSIFSRPLASRSDRYSRRRHALYASAKRETAEAEMRYYARTTFFIPTRTTEVMKFDIIEIGFDGLAARLSSLFRTYPWLKHKVAKRDTQEIGDTASDYLACLFVRSVRHPGDNSVVFTLGSLTPVAKRGELRIEVFKRGSGRATRLVV